MVSIRGVLFWILATLCVWSGVAQADLLTIVIDERALPYDLSPSNYENSPANYENSQFNYENSEVNYENSPANYKNSSANYENSSSGKKRLLGTSGEFLGYYVFSVKDRVNIFNRFGKRAGYIPSGGHTNSFFSESGWCGTLGQSNGQAVIGMTAACYRRLLLDR